MVTIQIVPRLFPSIDGVGDYALSLAHRLNRDFNIKTHFLVGDPKWRGDQEVDGFKISQLSKRTSKELISTLKDIREVSSSIILQYVGGGYAKRACPVWLVDGLEKHISSYPKIKLTTMFHETYGSGPPYYGQDPPWISAFWLSPLQKNIASRLTLLSDLSVTSREHFRDQLIHLTRGQKNSITVAPVFSNVGEAPHLSPLKHRNSVLVLFGSSRSRARVYEQFSDEIRNACKMLEIEKIYDIGPSTGLNVTEFSNIPVVVLGEKTASEIGEILLSSRAGILNYHPEFLAKSGMYAAYSAYGLIPIVASSNIVRVDGMDSLHAGKHYWPIDSVVEGLNLEMGQMIANNAYAWYQAHNLAAHAQIFAKSIVLEED
jgi:hypothetical protein